MKTYTIKTYGCSMNYSDSERIATILEQYGLYEVSNYKDADLVVFTTCTIKQKAEDKVFSAISNVHKYRIKKNKNVKIAVTGCMVKYTSSRKKLFKNTLSNIKTEKIKSDFLLKKIPEIDFVFRIEDISMLHSLLNIEKKIQKKDYFEIIPKYSSQLKAIIPIQNGCDNFCSYCVVPYTRGRESSRPMNIILKEIESLAKIGLKEVNLVGQNVNSYGKGNQSTKRKWDKENSKWIKGKYKTPFAILLEEVNKIDGIERIRFQSSNPHDMTDDIIEAICTLNKVMPSLHFGLQSGDDNMLKRMNRNHTYQDYKNIVEKIRKLKPDFSITTDIIVGFCGETEKEFQNTLKAVKEINVDMIYISQYSPRKETIAFKNMRDDVSAELKKKRWHILNNWLKNHIREKMQSLIGSKQKVLIEHCIKDYAEGKTEHNRHCQIVGSDFQIGDIVDIEIIGSSNWAIRGKKIPNCY